MWEQHKSSTANFKTSKRKLNDLSRLIVGRTADEGVLQLQVSTDDWPGVGSSVAASGRVGRLSTRAGAGGGRGTSSASEHQHLVALRWVMLTASLSLQVSPKGQASRLLSMLALARDHAIAKGLNRDKLVIGALFFTSRLSIPVLTLRIWHSPILDDSGPVSQAPRHQGSRPSRYQAPPVLEAARPAR